MKSERSSEERFRDILCDLEIVRTSLMQPTMFLLGVEALERVRGYLGLLEKSPFSLSISQLEQIRELLNKQQKVMNTAEDLLASWKQSLQGKGLLEGYTVRRASTPSRILAQG